MKAPARWSHWLLVALALPPPWPLSAQRPGQPFTPPLKNFTVPVPAFAFGTGAQKSNNRDGGLVVFLGGLGDLERIDYARLPPGALVAQDSTARQQGYRNALDAMVRANHADGSNPTRLTNHPAEDRFPDRDGNWEIYVMNADGTGLVNVTANPAVDVEPHWRPKK